MRTVWLSVEVAVAGGDGTHSDRDRLADEARDYLDNELADLGPFSSDEGGRFEFVSVHHDRGTS